MEAAAVAREGENVDVEAPKAEPARDGAEAEEQAVGVGVLGWLGFIIVNLAAWGFITFASFVSWTFGLGVCVLYTVLLIGLAVWLERRGAVYKQFVNLLWVLAGWFLFISGGYVAVNSLGEGFASSNGPQWPVYPFNFAEDMGSLVPANASAELRTWATERFSNNGPTFVAFAGAVLFNGRGRENSDTLRYSDGTTVGEVFPNATRSNEVARPIGFATNFRVVESTLYFLSNNRLYTLTAGNLSSAQEIAMIGDATGLGSWQELYVESNTSQVYLKGRLSCSAICSDILPTSTSVESIFTLQDSTTVTDLRGDTCALWNAQVTCPAAGGGSSVLPGPQRANLWGIIFIAAVPMLILSFYVLIRKQMPGLVFNIFGGVQAIVIMVYLLIEFENPGAGLTDFLKWFMMIYTSVLWKALLSWSLVVPMAAPWLEEVKTWSAAVLGTTFFVTIHFVLEVPFTEEAWRWVLYGLLAALQMVMSAVVQRTIPMVMGALAAFVVAWKVGFEVAVAFDFGSSEVQYLVTFAIIGLEGVGIILAASAFARNREQVQDWVRGLLCCAPCRTKTQPE